MVSRQLIRASALAVLAAAVAALAIAPAADAANRRIAISNYQWSDPDIHVDLGEHVTWYWVGPDVVHSVTGFSDNDRLIDSDPNNSLPQHPVGDSFKVDFDRAGSYSFRCKLHSTVRGTVTVSDTPGDPNTEPDPVPPARVDLKAPRLRKLQLASPIRGRGGQLHFNLGERAKLVGDYYRVDAHGKRSYAGWARWSGYVGFNEVRFGGRGKHFDAAPGRYVAVLRATDHDQNESDPRQVHFKISPKG